MLMFRLRHVIEGQVQFNKTRSSACGLEEIRIAIPHNPQFPKTHLYEPHLEQILGFRILKFVQNSIVLVFCDGTESLQLQNRGKQTRTLFGNTSYSLSKYFAAFANSLRLF